MNAQAVIALVIVAIGVVLVIAAVVVVLRWAVSASRWPSLPASMTWAQRRHASAQMRSGRPVPADQIADVRKIAVQAATQRRLALIPAASTVTFVGMALTPLPFPLAFLSVLMALVALVMAACALVLLDHAGRARRFLQAHPDPASAAEGPHPVGR